jgi:chromosomal replication initiator protein
LAKQQLREHLNQAFTDPELKRWFDPLDVDVSEAEKTLFVFFPHPYFGSWFQDNVQARFEREVGEFMGQGYQIQYGNGQPKARDRGLPGPMAASYVDFPFGRQFTFEDFLVNKKNYFPLASAREVAKQTTTVFNPFIICGEGGSGKTHLLKALANDVTRRIKADQVFFGTVDDVANVFTSMFPRDAFKARNWFSGFAYLFIDDFHTIGNNTGLQQEFITLFNQFYDERRQMVFTCSGKLTAYDFLDPKLKSRLEWGLIVNLKKPDLDIRVQYIEGQVKAKKIGLNKEQILTLAQRFRDFRYLQGILLKIVAYRELVSKDLSPQDFEDILAHTEEKPTPSLDAETIINQVAAHFELAPRLIKSDKRQHHIVQARQTAMYLCRKLLGISLPRLGRLFGGKDHSTVLYAINKIKQLQEDNREMKNLLIDLEDKCLNLDQE